MFKKNIVIIGTIFLLLFYSSQVYSNPTVFTDTPEDAFILSEVIGTDVLLIFTASWCRSCVVMKNDLHNNLDIIEDMIICYVDHEHRTDMVKEYDIKVLPTYFIYRNKKEIKRATGYKGLNKFKEWLSNDRK